MKKHLQNTMYRDFVRDHVIRPYQSMLFTDQKPMPFTSKIYDTIPDFVADDPRWADMVFSRIADIFERIDTGVFPSDLSAMVILTEAAKRGVIIEYT